MTETTPKPLCVIPVFIHKEAHVQMLRRCLETLRDPLTNSVPVDIIMVDDCSPAPDKSNLLKSLAEEFQTDLVEKPENTGFSKTVNIGMLKAHAENRVCVLVNMDIEFMPEFPDWLQEALDDPADLIGARLLYPSKFIQHGGVYYSLLHRYLDHKFRWAPHNMPEALLRCECPVTGALHIIKPQVMDAIGYYDENFKMAYEDVDYCLRALLPKDLGGASLSVVYNPRVVALHHESPVRGGVQKYSQWHDESWAYFLRKYATTPMAMFIPQVDIERNEDGSPIDHFGSPQAADIARGQRFEAWQSQEREHGNRPALAVANTEA